MAWYDFGDRAAIQTLAYRIGVCFLQMEDEMRKSPNEATASLRGLAYWAKDEIKKMMHIISSLSQSSIDSLNVEFRDEKIPLRIFMQQLIPIAQKVTRISGINVI
jgi:hypothetical protein